MFSRNSFRGVLLLAFCASTFWATIGGASEKFRGPFRPIVARQKLTYISEDPHGAKTVISEFTGSYLRSSDGSELATLGLVVNGKEAPPSEGRLRLAKDGASYKLDYMKHTATQVVAQATPLKPRSPDALKKEDIVGHETINGMHCIGVKVLDHGEETGTSWREPKNDVLVRLVSYFGSKEDHVRVVLERYDISMRQEPDESLFALTGKWTIIAPSPAPIPSAPAPEPLLGNRH